MKESDMSNLIFSLNVTMPIFLVMVIGWILKRAKMLNENFVTVANRLNFNVTLPVLVFLDIAGLDIRTTFDASYVAFCAAASSISFFAIWALTRKFLKNSSMRGAFVQASFRSSAAVMGLAFIDNIYGSSAMGPLMIIGAVPLYNIFSVIVLSVESSEAAEIDLKKKVKDTLMAIICNPIIIAILLGILVSLLQLQFPLIIDKTLESIGRIATPLALLAMGAGFKGSHAVQKIRPTLAAAGIKLVLQVLVFVPLAILAGYTGEKLIAILIMLGAPATPSCYIMAKNMGNDGELTASIVVVTTLLAAFTLTGFSYLLRTFGYI